MKRLVARLLVVAAFALILATGCGNEAPLGGATASAPQQRDKSIKAEAAQTSASPSSVADESPLYTFASVSSGLWHTCGLSADGAAVCWGNNKNGQSSPPQNEPFKSVSAGGHHSCGARVADGAAACWGNNEYGQSLPPQNETFASVSAGLWHSCGVSVDGATVCWGNNEYGQSLPPQNETFASVSVGGQHSCGLRADGVVMCWGRNDYGEASPPQDETFVSVSAGWEHTCGLRADAADMLARLQRTSEPPAAWHAPGVRLLGFCRVLPLAIDALVHLMPVCVHLWASSWSRGV